MSYFYHKFRQKRCFLFPKILQNSSNFDIFRRKTSDFTQSAQAVRAAHAALFSQSVQSARVSHALLEQRVNLLVEHIQRDLIIAALRNDDVGKFLARLHELLVHRLDRRQILRHDGLQRSAALVVKY